MTDTLPMPQPPALSAAQQAQVINILRRAARAEVLPRFRNLAPGDIDTKSGPLDLVTAADIGAEAMVTRALQRAFPSALIVGEEAVAKDPALLDKIADAPLAFILDPIDGTSNFAHGLALFGMILAVTRFGKTAFGAIYDPVNDDWVVADDHSPAQLQRPSAPPRDLRVSQSKPVEEMHGYIPLAMFPKEHQARVAGLLPGFERVNSLRCSAQEYRMMAQGHSDFMISGSLHPWDHAAGALICERAGAHVEMLSGGQYDATLRKGYLLVASDKTAWNRLKKLFGFLLA